MRGRTAKFNVDKMKLHDPAGALVGQRHRGLRPKKRELFARDQISAGFEMGNCIGWIGWSTAAYGVSMPTNCLTDDAATAAISCCLDIRQAMSKKWMVVAVAIVSVIYHSPGAADWHSFCMSVPASMCKEVPKHLWVEESP